MIRWIKPIIAIAVIALAVWQVRLLMAALASSRNTPSAETALVKRGPFVVGITREGTLESANIAQVRAPQSGSTLTWVIDDGAKVASGDLVAKVDVSQYKFSVEQQRLEYQNRTAQVEQERRNRSRDSESAEMNVDKAFRELELLSRSQSTETEQGQARVGYDGWNRTWAQADFDKQSRLWDAGIVPKTSVEQSERVVRSRDYALNRSEKELGYLDTQHSSKRAQSKVDIDTAKFEAELAERRIEEAVDSAGERTRLAKERLSKMEEHLAQGELRAPQAGVVVLGKTWDETGRRELREGDRVRSRMKVADITDLSELLVSMKIEDSAAGRLKLGQEAIVKVIGVSEREFKGKLTSMGAVARRVPPWEDPDAPAGQRIFDIKVKVLDPDPKLVRPGTKAEVQFVFEKLPAAIYVPLKAVFDKPGGQVAYVAVKDGFEERRVETGKRNDEAVVVKSGLKPGERVALSDPTHREAE